MIKYDFKPNKKNTLENDKAQLILYELTSASSYYIEEVKSFFSNINDFKNKMISEKSLLEFIKNFSNTSSYKRYPYIYNTIKNLKYVLESINDEKYKFEVPLSILQLYFDKYETPSFMPQKGYDFFCKFDEDFVIENKDVIKSGIEYLDKYIPNTMNISLFREINNINDDDVRIKKLKNSDDYNYRRRKTLRGVSNEEFLKYPKAFDIGHILDTVVFPEKIINTEEFFNILFIRNESYYSYYNKQHILDSNFLNIFYKFLIDTDRYKYDKVLYKKLFLEKMLDYFKNYNSNYSYGDYTVDTIRKELMTNSIDIYELSSETLYELKRINNIYDFVEYVENNKDTIISSEDFYYRNSYDIVKNIVIFINKKCEDKNISNDKKPKLEGAKSGIFYKIFKEKTYDLISRIFNILDIKSSDIILDDNEFSEMINILF